MITIGAKWTKFETRQVDTWETRYIPRRPIKVPVSDSDFKKVVKRLRERLRKHHTKFAYIRMKLLIEEGLYHTTFEIDEPSGLAIQYANTRTIPRWKGAKFTPEDLFTELRGNTLARIEEVVRTQEKVCFIVHFDIVAHDGFWQKVKKNVPSSKQQKFGRKTFRKL